jgi:hypothetical protein
LQANDPLELSAHKATYFLSQRRACNHKRGINLNKGGTKEKMIMLERLKPVYERFEKGPAQRTYIQSSFRPDPGIRAFGIEELPGS